MGSLVNLSIPEVPSVVATVATATIVGLSPIAATNETLSPTLYPVPFRNEVPAFGCKSDGAEAGAITMLCT